MICTGQKTNSTDGARANRENSNLSGCVRQLAEICKESVRIMSETLERNLVIGETGKFPYVSEVPGTCIVCSAVCGDFDDIIPRRGVVIFCDKDLSASICLRCAPVLATAIGYSVGIATNPSHHTTEELAHNKMITFFWKGIADGRAVQLRDIYYDKKELDERLSESDENNQILLRHIQYLDSEAERTEGEGYVYLMHRDDGCHKIGLSGKPDRRLSQIQRDFPSATLVHTMRADDMRQAEKMMHDEFSAKRKDGEWFNLSAQEVEAICQRIRFEDGWFLTRHEATL